jgi:ribulose-phosphate 3-epimerase
MDVGVALKPGTDVSEVRDFVSLVDMVLIMTVEPGEKNGVGGRAWRNLAQLLPHTPPNPSGFGGQKFMPNMMPKVVHLRNNHPNLNIQVDGGLSPATIDVAARAGANSIVAGSAVFKAADKEGVILGLRNTVERCVVSASRRESYVVKHGDSYWAK